jgi:SAM-dependent methyltransferase
MGLELIGLRTFSLIHRLRLADFDRTISLGRQMSMLDAAALRAARRLTLPPCELQSIAEGQYIEPLFTALGARRIVSMDASSFEGASIVHDFNQDVPNHLRGQFSAYVDLGSMEHVFSVAQSVLNVNRLLADGGRAIILTISNGFSGHGFYQFSPEFYFSAFAPPNGFDEAMVVLIDAHRPRRWYFIRNPAAAGGRMIVPNRAYAILCIARKIRTVDGVVAQQSDYAATWRRANDGDARPAKRFPRARAAIRSARRAIARLTPGLVSEQAGVLRARNSFRHNVRRFDPDTISAQELAALRTWSASLA